MLSQPMNKSVSYVNKWLLHKLLLFINENAMNDLMTLLILGRTPMVFGRL